MDCSLPVSYVPGIFQARIMEWVAISFSRGSSWPRDRTQVSHIADRHFTVWATREALSYQSPPLSLCSLKALMPVCFLLFHLNKLFFFPLFPVPCLIFLKFILNVFFGGQISQIFSRTRQHINQFKKLHNAHEASHVKILRGPDFFFSFTLCHSFFLPPPSLIADHSTAVLPQLSVTHPAPPIPPSSLPPHSLLLWKILVILAKSPSERN